MRVPPSRNSMIRMLSGPPLVVVTTERGTPSASIVVVAMRNPGVGGRDACCGQFLRLELGGREGGVRDLHHADGLAARPGEEVLVLLAAERGQLHVEPPVRADDLRDLGDREVRRRQLARAEEVEPDRAGGLSAAAVHAHPFPGSTIASRAPEPAWPPCRTSPKPFAAGASRSRSDTAARSHNDTASRSSSARRSGVKRRRRVASCRFTVVRRSRCASCVADA